MGCGGSTNSGSEPHQQYDKTNNVNSKTNNNNNNNYYDNKRKGANTKNLNNSYNNNNVHNKENSRSPRRARPYPESKYAASNGSASTDFGDSKGYKRRIRTQLQDATAGTSIEDLERAMTTFEKNHMEDAGDLSRANDRLDYLKMKRDLRDAIRRSNVGVLERTIAEARACPYAGQLASQIEAAERKLEHLRELNSYSHDILAMDQSTISELHSYHRPPTCVHDVMAASHMLIGYKESKLQDWSYIQGLAGRVGRDSLIHKVREFDSSTVDQRTSSRVREILNYHDLDEVRAASNGAATFHVWASNVVDKIERDKSEEQERKRLEEEGTAKNGVKTPNSKRSSRR